MDSTKFKLIENPTITDMYDVVHIMSKKYDKDATPLFRHRKSLNELAKTFMQMFMNDTLAIFENTETHKLAGVVACVVGNLWWIEGDILFEELVCSLEDKPTGFGSFAVGLLEEIAENNGCVMICSGSSMVQSSKIVQNMYKNHGFVVYGESYLKEME
jgi:hypothetical protein